MKALVHISDPHFGTEQPPVVEALVRLVHDKAPELAVLSGDTTQRASREQFRAAKKLHRAARGVIVQLTPWIFMLQMIRLNLHHLLWSQVSNRKCGETFFPLSRKNGTSR